jgi:hypothetical protein
MTETERIDKIAEECGISFSVADDVDYLRTLERRIVAAARGNPGVVNFPVYNESLEDFISGLESGLEATPKGDA